MKSCGVCSKCGHDVTDDIPSDVVKMMEECGANDEQIKYNYKECCSDNPYYYAFFKTKCDLCGEMRVLGWEAGNSPPSREIIMPSFEIRFWPKHDYPVHKVRVCKFCKPDNDEENSRLEYVKKLSDAMLTKEKENWAWKKEHKR